MTPVPTGRLALVAAVGSVAVLALAVRPPWGLVAVDGGILLVAIVDWSLAPRPGAIGVERRLPGIVPLGGEAEVVWRVSNAAGRVVRLRLADELAPSLRPSTRRARLVVPARGRVAARAAIRPSRRGRFQPTEVVVRVEGPLGLLSRQGRRSLPGVLRVYPP